MEIAVPAHQTWRARSGPAALPGSSGASPNDGASPVAICGQPARVGDALQIYLTGLGKATPGGDPNGNPLPTGSVAPANGSTLYLTVRTPNVKTLTGRTASQQIKSLVRHSRRAALKS